MTPTSMTLAGLLLAASAAPAFAHATFEVSRAAPNSTWKAVLRVPHGCEGQATQVVRVTIPDGIIAVKPMPKPGWTLATRKGAYSKAYDYFGKPMSEGVTEITWSGGNLPDDQYDEFVFQGRVTDAFAPGSTVHLPVVQECASAKAAWIEIPKPGQDAHALKMPAPGLTIIQAQHAAAPHGAKTYKLGALTIETPWTRVTPPGAKVAGAYMRITNAGSTPDKLIGGSALVAGKFEVHEMAMKDGVMTMREVAGGLVIPPHGSVELKPGSFHVMFMDMKETIREGAPVKGTLVFEKAGTIEVEFAVGAMGSREAPGGGHGAH